MSNTGKFFFCCAVAIGIAALVLIKRGEWIVGSFIGIASILEFALAYSTKRAGKAATG